MAAKKETKKSGNKKNVKQKLYMVVCTDEKILNFKDLPDAESMEFFTSKEEALKEANDSMGYDTVVLLEVTVDQILSNRVPVEAKLIPITLK